MLSFWVEGKHALNKHYRNTVEPVIFSRNQKYMIRADIHWCMSHEISHVSLNTRDTDRVIFMGIFHWISFTRLNPYGFISYPYTNNRLNQRIFKLFPPDMYAVFILNLNLKY